MSMSTYFYQIYGCYSYECSFVFVWFYKHVKSPHCDCLDMLIVIDRGVIDASKKIKNCRPKALKGQYQKLKNTPNNT